MGVLHLNGSTTGCVYRRTHQEWSTHEDANRDTPFFQPNDRTVALRPHQHGSSLCAVHAQHAECAERDRAYQLALPECHLDDWR